MDILKAAIELMSSKKEDPLKKEIFDQYAFSKYYLNSPKYTERLGKMINTEKKLDSSNPYTTYFQPGSRYRENLLSAPTKEVISNALKYSNYKLTDLLKKGKINLTDKDLGKDVGGTYWSATNQVDINRNLAKNNRSVPSHEFSHATLSGSDPYSSAFKEKYVNPLMVSPTSSDYRVQVQEPTELKARLDAVRYLAYKKGLYDPGTQTFDQKALDKLKKDKEISNDFNFKQIMSQLNDKSKNTGFIWLMNNIAKLNKKPEVQSSDQGSVA